MSKKKSTFRPIALCPKLSLSLLFTKYIIPYLHNIINKKTILAKSHSTEHKRHMRRNSYEPRDMLVKEPFRCKIKSLQLNWEIITFTQNSQKIMKKSIDNTRKWI